MATTDRCRQCWWRDRNGGYGWVGPLYWPFAYNDMYDYAMWGYGYDNSFWGYGYGDIYAGIFAPYGYDDLTGYLPQYAGSNPGDVGQTPPVPARRRRTRQMTQMCGADSNDLAGLPIDQFKQAISRPPNKAPHSRNSPTPRLRRRKISRPPARPTLRSRSEPSRGHATPHRGDDRGDKTVRPPLEKFYGL